VKYSRYSQISTDAVGHSGIQWIVDAAKWRLDIDIEIDYTITRDTKEVTRQG